jgi:hypothetical protein
LGRAKSNGSSGWNGGPPKARARRYDTIT